MECAWRALLFERKFASLITRSSVPSRIRRYETLWKTFCTDSRVENGDINSNRLQSMKRKLKFGPQMTEFFMKTNEEFGKVNVNVRLQQEKVTKHPYIKPEDIAGNGRKVFFETYGCQMNVNDTEIAWTILENNGYQKSANINESDVILVMTCAIRDGAEQKIWNRLQYLKHLKRKREMDCGEIPLKIGILGCMAERLKQKILEKEKMVDLVAGPDSYRDLPRLLAVTNTGSTAVNVLLSLDETYADVIPVRTASDSKSAYVSIMRGCDNMCSYCIVPFTRGRERSRPISSILEEIRFLSDRGIKQITLLGQNVNSYCDTSEMSSASVEPTHLSRGFKTIYKPKLGGRRFADLLDQASRVNPEIRIRFTSPHPKDFPDEVLWLLKERNNICNHLHLPAQCGSNKILENMRRGYTRESYIDLVHHIRETIPDVAICSDFICGFCEETEQDFQQTLSLIHEVKYNFAYMFPYSMREKTHAHHKFVDDVPHHVKTDRLERMIAAFRHEAEILNRNLIGTHQLVLIEGVSKKSSEYLAGRTDGNTKVILPRVEVPTMSNILHDTSVISVGDYVVVQVNDANSQVLKGIPLYRTTLQEYGKSSIKFIEPCQRVDSYTS